MDISLKIGNIRYIVDNQAFNWQQNWLQVGNRSATDRQQTSGNMLPLL
jgi:hypothetical protein